MEKDGVRGAAESSLHALSSAAGAITGIAILDVGRHIADELIQMTAALNDMLGRATRLVTLSNAMMLEKMAEKMGMEMDKLPNAMSISPEVTKYEIETVQPRLWVHPVEETSVVAGEKLSVTWETVGHVPMINVRLKNCMGVETSRGKTVLRLTKECGEANRSTASGGIPFDFPPGKYTLAVSDPANNIRGMTFLSVLRPISVADVIEPPSGVRNLTWRHPTWSRGSMHTIKWKVYKGKAAMVSCYIAIGPSSEGPWRALRGAHDLRFKVPDLKRKDDHVHNLKEASAGASEQAAPRSGGGARLSTDKQTSPELGGNEGEMSLWRPEDDEDEGAPAKPAGHDWLDDKSDGQKKSQPGSGGSTVVSSVGSTFTGLFGTWKSTDALASGTPSKPAESDQMDDLFDQYTLVETMDCAFDWMVSLDIEPGKYILRIVPTGYDSVKFGPDDQARRARESGTIIIT